MDEAAAEPDDVPERQHEADLLLRLANRLAQRLAGHLRAGETLGEAIREAEEEIGLVVTLEDVVRLGRRFAHSASDRDNEVQEVFAVRSDLPLGAYRLHEDEVDGICVGAAGGRDRAVRRDRGGGRGRRAAARRPDATPVEVTIAGFAAGERGGYPALALRGLREVLGGRIPTFELRR